MKKTKSSIIALGAIAVIAFSFIYLHHKTDSSSGLTKENIEALSQTETSVIDCPPGGYTECARILQGNTVHIFYRK